MKTFGLFLFISVIVTITSAIVLSFTAGENYISGLLLSWIIYKLCKETD
jgi:hypothetical protein